MLLSSGDSSGKLGQGYLAEKDSNGTKPFFSRFPDPPAGCSQEFLSLILSLSRESPGNRNGLELPVVSKEFHLFLPQVTGLGFIIAVLYTLLWGFVVMASKRATDLSR